MSVEHVGDTLLIMVGVALVAVGAVGVQHTLSVIWMIGSAPGLRIYAPWLLGAGLGLCGLGLMLGRQGIGGFTTLPASIGSFIGTLVAVVMVSKLIIYEVQLGRGIVCQATVESVEYAPNPNTGKSYLVTTKVSKVLKGYVDPEGLVFRVAHQDRLRAGAVLKVTYRKKHRWRDLKTIFRHRMRDAFEDAVSLSIQQ